MPFYTNAGMDEELALFLSECDYDNKQYDNQKRDEDRELESTYRRLEKSRKKRKGGK